MWQLDVVAFIRGLVERMDWVPGWGPGLAAIVLLTALGYALHGAIARLGLRLARGRPFVQRLIARSRRPTRILLVLLMAAPVVPSAGFPYGVTEAILRVLLVVFVLVVGWGCIIATGLAADLYLLRFRTDTDDNLLARKHITQIRILSRAADTLIAIVAVSAALMTIPEVRQYGLSLFASAGAAGLVLGLASRPLLTNLIAGIQIAVTQPIRVEDAVIVEGEYGWIEEIGSTYVVVRLWDLRRMIVPLSYFIEKPFQNWTHTGSALMGAVYLYVDWTVPVERLRQRLGEIVRASPLWDGVTVGLQVTDTKPDTVEVRALVSARNAGRLWDLRCLVREQLIAFLQAEYPQALPHARVAMDEGRPGRAASDQARAAGTRAAA